MDEMDGVMDTCSRWMIMLAFGHEHSAPADPPSLDLSVEMQAVTGVPLLTNEAQRRFIDRQGN
jgi:hypothetical protein